MHEPDDMALLREYAAHGSEAAFAELVSRRVGFVYSAALRQVGDPHQAREIAQAVFVILAQKAGRVSDKTNLTGWLFKTARFVALAQRRAANARRQREQEFHMRTDILNATADPVWELISPYLDEALMCLGEKDRQTVLLHYFDKKSFAEIGMSLGMGEVTARKRASRALERLRKFLTKRGVSSTTAIIAGAISANSVQAAPIGLAKIISAVAIAKGATAGGSTLILVKGALKFMAWTKTQADIVGVVIVGAVTYSVMQHQAQGKLRARNESLQQQMAQIQAENERLSKPPATTPHLPAPQIQMAVVATNAPPEENVASTNLYARLVGKDPKLTHDQVETYLNANGRSAANLLAAFRTSGNPVLLKEAMEKYPNDTQVAFEAAISKDLSPEEQRQWLNTFEKSAPDNALANYLSALNYFNSGQIDQGVQELNAASGKHFDDYTTGRIEDDMEAYLGAGYSMADAKVAACMQLMMPQLSQVKQLGRDTLDLANAYRQTGDNTSAQAALQMAENIGRQYANPSPGEPTISQLVGIWVAQHALQAMDPSAPYGNSGQTVQDQINQLAQQNTAVRTLNQQAEALLPAMSDQDWIIYKDRWLMFGEENAERWVVGKYGQP